MTESYTRSRNLLANAEMPDPQACIFVDTSAFIALRDSKDINHRRAKDFLEEIKKKRTLLVATNFVFDEVYTYFCRFHKVAVEMGEYRMSLLLMSTLSSMENLMYYLRT